MSSIVKSRRIGSGVIENRVEWNHFHGGELFLFQTLKIQGPWKSLKIPYLPKVRRFGLQISHLCGNSDNHALIIVFADNISTILTVSDAFHFKPITRWICAKIEDEMLSSVWAAVMTDRRSWVVRFCCSGCSAGVFCLSNKPRPRNP